jgi:hypothetical protein
MSNSSSVTGSCMTNGSFFGNVYTSYVNVSGSCN